VDVQIDTVLTRRSAVEGRPLPAGSGAVLVDMSTGRCFRLNRVGNEVWGMLGEGLTMREICARVAGRYQLPTTRIESEVMALVAQLAREGLVEPVPTSAT